MNHSFDDSRISVQRFNQIPFIVHGFGTGKWTENYFKKESRLKAFHPVVLKQIHSDIIHSIDDVTCCPLEGDGLITASTNLLLVIKTADCLPILLVDELWGVVGAVHCGWKGTGKQLIKKIIHRLQIDLGSSPDSLLAAMGPCIGAQSYEVGADVKTFFADNDLPLNVFKPHPMKKNKYLLDLKASNRQQMINAGISPKNIFSVDICTNQDERFFSYRRDKDNLNRMFNFIGILP